mgnify:CR=1 FL=1
MLVLPQISPEDLGGGVYNFSFVPTVGVSGKVFVWFADQPVPGTRLPAPTQCPIRLPRGISCANWLLV